MIVNNDEDDFYGIKGKGKCQKCNEKLHHFPFLVWMEQGEPILLCPPCGHIIKKGLMADLIQLAAIGQLHTIGYHQTTFCRHARFPKPQTVTL